MKTIFTTLCRLINGFDDGGTELERHGGTQRVALNDDFTKRLEDVNRYQDDKEIGDKRPIMDSPPAPERMPWTVEVEDSEEEEKEDE
ncbi:unnamed protein product [Rhizophagus irregularis]|uniref:Uncharacterized protein n=1 Tax=Rhizophagus irregularis TaxID=588596 RepID=A0A2N1M7A4_9GLOM|nr:hypothetical protein RhiirC2_797881 [Rhizophagus irregularis]CAB4383684.1 unnamed protein product [Rhizophagus irregularis]